jgi:radical SAM superfamily enzyme YgiQ (UPF0313 family)
MKVALVQKIPYEYIGVMFLSAVIKKGGGESASFIAALEGRRLLPNLRQYQPDLVAFSLLSPDHRWFAGLVREVKAALPGVPVIAGGPHPTFFPEIIEWPELQAVFVGEAEGSLAAFLRHFGNDGALGSIPGIWYKDSGGAIRRNPVGPLVQDLDRLPFPDRSIYYDKYPVLKNKEVKTFITSRGCPNNCSFCYNHGYRELYRGGGRYVRHFSPERIIAEIKETRAMAPAESIEFQDDAFTYNPEWLDTFLALYKAEVGLPFKCLVRADMVTPEIARQLRTAGLSSVIFGVESGSETIRNTALKKHITNRQITGCADTLHAEGIKFGTSNMFGIPGETVEDALETIRLNIRIKTFYPWASLLMPYPRTKIAEICRERGLIPADFSWNGLPGSFFSETPLRLPEKHVYENLQKVFYLAVRYPWTFPLFQRMVKLRLPRFFKALFVVSYILKFAREKEISLFSAMRILWHFRDTL